MITRKGYVDAPTGQVHYQEAGSGVPLLLFHQSPNSSNMFEAVYGRLADRGIRAIGMDTPGFGNSAVPAPRPSIATYASVVPFLLDSLGLDKVVVLGHHTGASTATEFAVSYPNRVRGVILNGVPLYNDEERAVRISRAPQGPPTIEPDGSHLLNRWNRRIKATPGYSNLRAMHRGVLQTLWAGDTDWYGHMAAFEYAIMDRYLALPDSTLILTNTGDDLYDFAQRAHTLRPELAYHELTGGTHDIIDEQPDAWSDVVADYVLRMSR